MPILSSQKKSEDFSRPYRFHGIKLEERGGEAVGDCPFCGREGKFSLNMTNGLWKCWLCQTGSEKGGGNLYTFLRALHKQSDEATQDYESLATERRYLSIDTLLFWELCKSSITGEWLIPGYGVDHKLNQLYTYLKDFKSDKMRLFPTPSIGHQLHGMNLFDPKKPFIYICEGPWDAMALWEAMRISKRVSKPSGKGLDFTANESESLLSQANVIAIPGCGSVGEPFKHWLPLFAGKIVIIMFDNDHPRKHPVTGAPIAPAGLEAVKRAAYILSQSSTPPSEVRSLSWGQAGWDSTYPSGYDVRDWLTLDAPFADDRVGKLQTLLAKITTLQTSPGVKPSVNGQLHKQKRGDEILTTPCQSWEELLNAWKIALKMTPGLERGLAVSLAVIASTPVPGDQLWVKLMGPPSCGKSTICEALSVSRKFVYPVSTITGFHSGFKTDKDGKEDNSLVAQAKDRCLVVKDADTILKAPNCSTILSQARDIYDRVSRTKYLNGVERSYEDLSMTILLCGTESLRALDSTELGARFLDCVIVEGIDPELEDEIGWRIANRVDRDLSAAKEDQLDPQGGPELVLAKQLTGGYIDYLRRNVDTLIRGVVFKDNNLKRCQRLAQFVASMRARPSTHQQEKHEKELPYRLISQLIRLSKLLAVALQTGGVDDEIMVHTRAVAFNTARGRVFDIAKTLHKAGKNGMRLSTILAHCDEKEEKLKSLLVFLRAVQVVESFNPALPSGKISTSVVKWRLTDRMQALYTEVHTYA